MLYEGCGSLGTVAPAVLASCAGLACAAATPMSGDMLFAMFDCLPFHQRNLYVSIYICDERLTQDAESILNCRFSVFFQKTVVAWDPDNLVCKERLTA
jgi:hypothetical protein